MSGVWGWRVVVLAGTIVTVVAILAIYYAPRVFLDARTDAANGVGTFWRNVWAGYKGVAADWWPGA